MHGLFITGTDTNVGKTHLTCWIARRLRSNNICVGAYKPVCSGADYDAELKQFVWSDVERLWDATGREFNRTDICPQQFQAPVAPPVAARMQGQHVNADLLRTGITVWKDRVDVLLVEGVGGWLSPLSERETVADLARDFGFGVLVIAPQRLGMIGQTLLTLESIANRQLPIVGVIVNEIDQTTDRSSASNIEELRKFTNVPILGVFQNDSNQPLQSVNALTTINWMSLIQSTRK